MMVDDHFMLTRGSYQWNISSAQQIQRILSAQPDFLFNSDIFEMCGLQWMIQLYPNGSTNGQITTGNVGLFVRLLTFPDKWKYIVMHQTFICNQTNTVSHHINKYQQAPYLG